MTDVNVARVFFCMLTGKCSGRPLMLKEITATSILLTLWWSMAGFEIQAAQKEVVLDAESILERLKQLEGTWFGEGGALGGDSSSVVHKFRVVAGGIRRDGDHGSRRRAGNQHVPRQRQRCSNDPLLRRWQPAETQTRITPGPAASRCRSYSSMRPIWRIRRWTAIFTLTGKIVFVDSNHLESWWTVYKEGGEVAKSRFTLERTPDS